MERIRPLLQAHGLSRSVRHLGYVDRRDLIGLYAASKMLVFPSLFEGFGLPLLEAMSFGTPVLCSRIGSLPEVGGDAVLYFDPHSPEDIAQSIGRALDDEELRRGLVEAGRQQLERFSYRQTAQRTLEVFNQIRDGVLAPPNLPPFRPLISHNWLREGHSRWYFHAGTVKAIELKVVQPTLLGPLAEQTVRVSFDDQILLDTAVEPQRVYEFTLAPSYSNGHTTFHKLEICASQTCLVSGQTLSLQVNNIVVVQEHDKRLALVS
jgi:hypothetical protein